MIKIVKKTKVPHKRIMKIIYQITEDYNYDCADNYRYYKESDEEGKKLFEIIEEGGCCGSSQSKIKLQGKTYIIGFNYGH